MDGDVTAFAWDWASGIPEMLSEDGNLYLVGHETLGQWDGSEWVFYLPDALGSIRQETDGTGGLTDSREWTPFGVEVGTGQAGLGYTGEWWDSYRKYGILYLRARWLDGRTGRFTSPDPIIPHSSNPKTINRYIYVGANPINWTDHSGECRDGDQACLNKARQISTDFNHQVNFDLGDDLCIDLPGEALHWNTSELESVHKTLQLLQDFWGRSAFREHFLAINFRRVLLPVGSLGPHTAAAFLHSDPKPGRSLYPVGQSGGPVVEVGSSTYWDWNEYGWGANDLASQIGVLMHEMYHMFDWSASGRPSGFQDPQWWMDQCRATLWGGSRSHSINFGIQADWNLFECYYAYSHGEYGLPPMINSPAGGYAKAGPHEDFAVTYAQTTLYLLSGGKICVPELSLCLASQTTTPDVGASSNPHLDFPRARFFIHDCARLQANVDVDLWGYFP
jgi:RHS repeat-associated protein